MNKFPMVAAAGGTAGGLIYSIISFRNESGMWNGSSCASAFLV
jgi:hypothetical protein